MFPDFGAFVGQCFIFNVTRLKAKWWITHFSELQLSFVAKSLAGGIYMAEVYKDHFDYVEREFPGIIKVLVLHARALAPRRIGDVCSDTFSVKFYSELQVGRLLQSESMKARE